MNSIDETSAEPTRKESGSTKPKDTPTADGDKRSANVEDPTYTLVYTDMEYASRP